MVSLEHRNNAYRRLSGRGLEIGALHEPAPVPPGASIAYFDAMDEQEARKRFPEIDPARLVKVDFVGDLDREGLARFAEGTFDFIIINHVLEHLNNPVKTVREVFRVLRPGGLAVIAIPDKRFTFDRARELTSFAHLWRDYLDDVQESSDEHYIDFLRSAAPHVFQEPPESLPVHVARSRERKEHVHVWTSDTFKAFLHEALGKLNIKADCVYEITGDETLIEYFSLWQRR